MKVLATTVAVALVVSCAAIPFDADLSLPVNDRLEIQRINSNIKSWVAGENEFFKNWTMREAQMLLGTIYEAHNALPPNDFVAVNLSLPSDFDARTQWPGLIHPIRNQERCGSCWAFAGSEVLSDRFAIATKRQSPVLSPQDMVTCDGGDHGCSGGRLFSAWNYLKTTGIVTDSCDPYTAGDGVAGACASKCADGAPWKKYRAKDAYPVSGVEHIQQEIMASGPVEAQLLVYGSLLKYKSGVYHKAWWELVPKGGHAVKILGWGTEEGSDYWLVANSWSPTWGAEGYFKIRRGHNECGIEGGIFAGHADV